MTPGIGPINARRAILAGLRRRLRAMDRAYDLLSEDGNAGWNIRRAAKELLNDSAESRSDAYTALLKSLVETEYVNTEDLYAQRRTIRDLLALFGAQEKDGGGR